MNKVAPSLYTARTTAFATATAITDPTILNALNTFDLGLISNGLATKMKALYPFVGSTATTHKYNFMDARDLDVAFRLQFNGGWVHSANGAKGNGTNTFMNTFFTQNSFVNFSNGGIGVYSRTNETGNYLEGTNVNNFILYTKYTDNNLYFQTGSPYVGAIVADSLGLISGASISVSDRRIYKNGVLLNTETSTNVNIGGNNNICFGAGNFNSGMTGFSNKSYAMALLTEGMNDTDQTNLYTLVQAMQVSLARAV